MQHILLDADTGIDDALALLYACKDPAIHLEGVTTVFGNTTPAQGARNSLDLIALANPGYEIPVAMGAEKTLKGEKKAPDVHVHGANGIGDAILPPSREQPIAQGAVEFMLETSKRLAGELILVATGRLTNLALALKQDPTFAGRVKRAVIMGGCFLEAGNVSPVAEANICGDPEAAEIVFQSGMPITLVTLDVTKKTLLHKSQIEELNAHCQEENKPLVSFLLQALPYYMNFYKKTCYLQDCCPLHDPLAMLVAVNPSLVTRQTFPTHVDCSDGPCRGMVIPDRRERPKEGGQIDFCLTVEREKAVNQLLGAWN